MKKAIIAAVLAVFSACTALAAPPPTKVLVKNTASNPVPVTGTVGVSSNTTSQLLNPTTFTITAGSIMGMASNVDVSKCSSVRFTIVQTIPQSRGAFPVVACQLTDTDTNANIASGQLAPPPSLLGYYAPSLSIELPTPALHMGISCINTDTVLSSTVSFALYCR